MKIKFLSIAQRELDDAVAWYNHQASELGLKFLDELDKTIKRIVLFPEAGTLIKPSIRRYLLARFPYGIIYSPDKRNKTILVLAIMNLHREPRYWITRL